MREFVPLGSFTTLQVGGSARWFVTAESEDELREAIAFAKEHRLPLFVLAGGSNVLIADTGFDGLVIHIALKGIRLLTEQHDTNAEVYDVAAGESWDAFVSYAVGRGLGGVECLAGIPGSVGGTPIQNVGAYGQEVADSIDSVRAIRIDSLEAVELSRAECHFAYRTSLFNSTGKDEFVVTGVRFRLVRGAPGYVSYPDVQKIFANKAEAPTPANVAGAVRSIRRSKGMVVSADDPDSRSAGSFFRNPIVSGEMAQEIARRTGMPIVDVPRFPAGENAWKIPAAWLLERAGFHKGYRRGRAAISSKHSLALVNAGGATADDILALKDEIQKQVTARFGLLLEPEPVLIGF